MRKVLAVAALIVVQGSVGSAAECLASKAKYDALSPGMSYDQAIQVMGCSGEELSRSDIAGHVTFMVMWDGRGWGANMNAMFQDGRLVSKAQMGLK